MYKQVIGTGGVLRDVGPDGIARLPDGQWMRGPKGGLLYVTKDGAYVAEVTTVAQSEIIRQGGVPTDAILFAIKRITDDVGIAVQPDGTPFPNQPQTVTDPKTGQTMALQDFLSSIGASLSSATGMSGGTLALLAIGAYLLLRR